MRRNKHRKWHDGGALPAECCSKDAGTVLADKWERQDKWAALGPEGQKHITELAKWFGKGELLR